MKKKYSYRNPGLAGWMSNDDLEWLYREAKKCKSILEIGSWKGKSTHALLSGCKGVVTAVDTFKGSQDDEDETKEIGKKENVFREFKRNIGHFKNLRALKMTSEDAAKKLAGETFDMIFIDATHTYSETKNDILLWMDRAEKVLCGHDYFVFKGVKKAVDEVVGSIKTADVIWYKRIR